MSPGRSATNASRDLVKRLNKDPEVVEFAKSKATTGWKELLKKKHKKKKHNKVQLQGGKVTCSRSLSFKESSLLQEMLDFGYSMDEIDHKLSIHNDNYDAVYQILMGDYVAPEKLWEQTRGDYYE